MSLRLRVFSHPERIVFFVVIDYLTDAMLPTAKCKFQAKLCSARLLLSFAFK